MQVEAPTLAQRWLIVIHTLDMLVGILYLVSTWLVPLVGWAGCMVRISFVYRAVGTSPVGTPEAETFKPDH